MTIYTLRIESSSIKRFILRGVRVSFECGKLCSLLSEVQQNKGEISKWAKRRHLL